MKTTLLIITLALSSIIASGQEPDSTETQSTEQNSVIIRVVHTWHKKNPLSFWRQFTKKQLIRAEIHISYSNGKFKREYLSADGIRDAADNMKLIHKTLKPFLNDRHELVSHSAMEDKKKANYMWVFKEVQGS